MNIALVMVTADGKTKELPAMKAPITIGRAEGCKLRIPLAAISRKHCELVVEDDELRVRDLQSSNGTFVNKDRISQRELIPGDLVSVGPVVFVVRIDGFPKIIDPVISYANGAVGPEDMAQANAPTQSGVPTWSGNDRKSSGTAVPTSSPAKAPAASTPASPKPAKAKDDSGDFESLLADLSESDFDDIDLGEEKKK